MPQVPKPSDGWIDARMLALPPQTLERSEVDAFLQWLFACIAKRPEPLLLRECAAVARYLRWLSWNGVPLTVLKRGKDAVNDYLFANRTEEERTARRKLEQTANIVWSTLWQFGEFKPSTRDVALRFLQRHSETYFTHPYLQPAIAFIKTHEVPPGSAHRFRRPNLMSRHLNAQGHGNPRVRDDLLERIYAAYYAVPKAGMRNRSRKIAAALTAAKAGGRSWSWADVNDRVKAYERSQRSRLLKLGAQEKKMIKAEIERIRQQKADHWISSFKFARMVNSEQHHQAES
jgi:hypothetical protein